MKNTYNFISYLFCLAYFLYFFFFKIGDKHSQKKHLFSFMLSIKWCFILKIKYFFIYK